MRVVFLGTPAFAVPTLQRLVEAGPARDIHVVGVVCQPDRPAGRGGGLKAPAVKESAQRLGIAVAQPEKIRSDEAFAFLRGCAPDAQVVVAYGQIIPRRVFDLPRLGTINAHASLLPRYRGAAPIQWAIARGERVTGITTMRINEGLDTGDMLLKRECPIDPHETAIELSGRLAALAADLTLETLIGIERGAITPEPQNDAEATLAPLLKKEDGRVQWSWPVEEIYNRWRGFQPWPGVFAYLRGKQLSIQRCRVGTARPVGKVPGTLRLESSNALLCACSNGWLALDEVQLEGRKRLAGAEFARGMRLQSGERLT